MTTCRGSVSMLAAVARPVLAISPIESKSIGLKCRQAIALPVYAIALLLDYLSAGLGRLADWIAGDDWP